MTVVSGRETLRPNHLQKHMALRTNIKCDRAALDYGTDLARINP
jgi:hypothetical protein